MTNSDPAQDLEDIQHQTLVDAGFTGTRQEPKNSPIVPKQLSSEPDSPRQADQTPEATQYTSSEGGRGDGAPRTSVRPFELLASILQRPAPVPTPLQLAGTKHSLSGSDIPNIRNSRRKRPRFTATIQQPSRTFTLADLQDQSGPLSPLFFSASGQQRPAFPPRFSSTKVEASMLSRVKEDAGVRTLTMPQGSSPRPTSSSHTRPWPLEQRFSSSRKQSLEPLERSDQLHQSGVIELLDLDDRPTFIVDLADPPHRDVDSIPIVFANRSLKSCGSLLDSIRGKVDDPDSDPLNPRSTRAFRDWVYKDTSNDTDLEESSPNFVQNSLCWSLATLRNGFRVVKGTFGIGPSRQPSPAVASTVTTTTPDAQISSKPGAGYLGFTKTEKRTPTSPAPRTEAQDYFSSAAITGPAPPSLSKPADARRYRSSQSPGSVISPLGNRESTPARKPSPTFSVDVPTQLDLEREPSIETAAHLGQYHSQSDSIGFFDWTRLPNDENLPEHIRFARTVDWSATSLGPIEIWSDDLRQMVNLIMASPHPAAMYWGPDLVAIYNEAYVALAGQKHPILMGQQYSEAWSEIWDDIKEIFSTAMATGQATMKDDDCLFMKRNGFLEETYFSWSIVPMVGGDGRVMGLYNPAFEKTRRKIAERRMLTLREVGERTATARDVRGFWQSVMAALNCNERDTPFVLLYSLAEDDDSDATSVTESSVTGTGGIRQCYLEGALGVPTGHPAAPENMDLRSGEDGFAPMFREAMIKSQTLILEPAGDDKLNSLLEGLDWRGFAEPSHQVLICPITPTTSENTLGFLVLGVNPRRPYDDDYALFVQLLSRQLATSLASVVLFEEEIRRGQRAAKIAALDRIELSEQLAARTKEAIESETRFTRMAEFAPVGMFIADSDGQITFCNDTWYDITRVPRSLHFAENWVDYVYDADVPLVTRMWHDLVDGRRSVSTEFRFRAPWIDKSGATGETWVLFSAYPERNEDGSLKCVFGSITNISSQKSAEGLQKRKMEEAVELKRQQENFIDITSHEMRNPLSAILQCADEIVNSLTEAKAGAIADTEIALYDNNVDAAQTIALCAQHQKRIVDDVLTMSKLDSALLMVTPVDVQPLMVVQRALKMFEGELGSADIELSFKVDSSFDELGIDWVRCDPSRVMQVLINLTTNAIKFTTTEARRTIAVTLAASVEHPSLNKSTDVKYIPRRSSRVDMTQGQEWGEGDEVYIHFSVSDTGRGLSTEEKKSLFMRFSQASPRTHVQYGGSGLGLFISRELTELQGGEIGVASVAGEGSTFAFFVKARKSKAPENGISHLPPALGSRRSSAEKGIPRKDSVTKVRDFAAKPKDQPKEQLKILLVEDNLVNQRVLQKQLKKLDCEVHVANHGQEALDKLQNSWFWEGKEGKPEALDIRVVLMDQEMPVLDGISATRQIREYEKAGKMIRHVPVLGITANARPEQIQQLMDAGMDDVVSKPFRIGEIVPKVEELSARYRPRSEIV